MLIFDRFPSKEKAKAFSEQVYRKTGRKTILCDSQEESDAHDPFPFQLEPPIVLVERDSDTGPQFETKIERGVTAFGGVFAGT